MGRRELRGSITQWRVQFLCDDDDHDDDDDDDDEVMLNVLGCLLTY